jgi:hypothetical protein
MATLTIEVPDEFSDALSACDYMAIDRIAPRDMLRDAIYTMAVKLEDLGRQLHAIYDSEGGSDDLRTLAREIEGADIARRVKRLADGLAAL